MRRINLSDENEVREKVFSGVDKMNDLVSKTLGPNGRSVLIERGRGEPLIVDDGRRTAENIKLDDPVEQLAVRVLYGVTRKTDERVGDGTTTSMVLAHALLKDITETRISYGGIAGPSANVGDVDREIHRAKEEVIEKLNSISKPVKTEKQLQNIATLASGDPHIGELVGSMYKKLGKNGHITIEFNLLSSEIETEVAPGLRFTASYADAFMITDRDSRESVFKDIHVLVVNRKDLTPQMVKPAARAVQNAGKTGMIIIAPKFSVDFLESIYKTAVKGNFNVLCVRAPSLHSEHYKDIAIWTGGKMFSEKDELENISMQDFGYVEKIEVGEDECQLVEGAGAKEAVRRRIEEVKKEAELQKIHQFKQQRYERASALDRGVGVIKIGAPTDEERNWLKYKIEDAKHATKLAFQQGAVPGGGTTFKKIADELDDKHIMKKALYAPYNKLKENAAGEFSVEDDVVDPVGVEIAALENACSAVSKLMRIGGAIAFVPRSDVNEAFKKLMGEMSDEEKS